MDEGNVFEAIQEEWKHDLRRCWWIVDYNRQSLDGIVVEGLSTRLKDIFGAFDWDVVEIKCGALQRSAFSGHGGEALHRWIDQCPNPTYSALLFQGGQAWRARLESDFGQEITPMLSTRDDRALSELMANLGGHCLETLCETFQSVGHDRPTSFVACTVKGWGTPLAEHKDNHSGLMTRSRMADFQQQMNVPEGKEWDRYAGLGIDPATIRAALRSVPVNSRNTRRFSAARILATQLVPRRERESSTQEAFGRILHGSAGGNSEMTNRVRTMAPDVTVSKGHGPWVNRRGLFARREISDTFRDEHVPSAQKWLFSPTGQHIELGIAEMNLFLLLGAAGLSHSLFAERLLPVGTLYDCFLSRGLDALNHACYQDARFMVVGTPSGVSLAPEGGAHQSIGPPLIGMSQGGLAAFEPAFADELAVTVNLRRLKATASRPSLGPLPLLRDRRPVPGPNARHLQAPVTPVNKERAFPCASSMEWAFASMQRHGDAAESERTWLRDETGGSVYLHLSSRRLKQPKLRESSAFCQGVVDGAYRCREPGPGCDLVIANKGTFATEAISAAGTTGQDRREIGVLAVKSAVRLNAGRQAAKRVRSRGRRFPKSHIERLLAPLPHHTRIITVIDGHPATLRWLGGVRGHIVARHRSSTSGRAEPRWTFTGTRASARGRSLLRRRWFPQVRQCGWQPSSESMPATRARGLNLDSPDGLPGYAMPCLCDEFSGDVDAFQFADRSRVLVEPAFNLSRNIGFAYGPPGK